MKPGIVIVLLSITASLVHGFKTSFAPVPDFGDSTSVSDGSPIDASVATVWANTPVVMTFEPEGQAVNHVKVVALVQHDSYNQWSAPTVMEVFSCSAGVNWESCGKALASFTNGAAGVDGNYESTTYDLFWPETAGSLKVVIHHTNGDLNLLKVSLSSQAPPPAKMNVASAGSFNVVPFVPSNPLYTGVASVVFDGVAATIGGLVPPTATLIFSDHGSITLQPSVRVSLTALRVSFFYSYEADVEGSYGAEGTSYTCPVITVSVSENVNGPWQFVVTSPRAAAPDQNSLAWLNVQLPQPLDASFIKVEFGAQVGLRGISYVAVDEIEVIGSQAPSASSSPAASSAASSTQSARPPAPSQSPAPVPPTPQYSGAVTAIPNEIGVGQGYSTIQASVTARNAHNRGAALEQEVKFTILVAGATYGVDYKLDPPATQFNGNNPLVTLTVPKGSTDGLSGAVTMTAITGKGPTLAVLNKAQGATKGGVNALSELCPNAGDCQATVNFINACLQNDPCVQGATCLNQPPPQQALCECPAGYSGDGLKAGTGCLCGAGNLVVNGKATVGDGTPGGRNGLAGWTLVGSWVTALPNAIPTRADDPARTAFSSTLRTGSMYQDININCVAGQIMDFGATVYFGLGRGRHDKATLTASYFKYDSSRRNKVQITGGQFKRESDPDSDDGWVDFSVTTEVPENAVSVRLSLDISRNGPAGVPSVYVDNITFKQHEFKCGALKIRGQGVEVKVGCTEAGLGFPCTLGCKDGYVRTNNGRSNDRTVTGFCARQGRSMNAEYSVESDDIKCSSWSCNSYQHD
jgi:hypothetical protein